MAQARRTDREVVESSYNLPTGFLRSLAERAPEVRSEHLEVARRHVDDRLWEQSFVVAAIAEGLLVLSG